MTPGSATLSFSEWRSLAVKAARGAGLEWGLAEEAGWAAEWLARRSLPAAEWAAVWLAKSLEGQPNPIEAGVSLSERLLFCETSFSPQPLPDGLCAPGYLLPFLHRVAARWGGLALVNQTGVAAAVDPDGTVTFGPAWGAETRGWWLQPALPVKTPGRPTLSASLVDCLEGLALRTTVPPSDISRQDAGSATPDTD